MREAPLHDREVFSVWQMGQHHLRRFPSRSPLNISKPGEGSEEEMKSMESEELLMLRDSLVDVEKPEPYLPCRFANQFGYDQIYVGNPNQRLQTRGGLVDGARAWLWNITGCTGAKFSLPGVERKLELTFLQCRWLLAANEHVPVQTITESTDEEASRVATRMVYESELEKRKRDPVGLPSHPQQKEPTMEPQVTPN
ncbi:uncharacterized protein A4U43_C04F14670 [Asparagus officinalis]|uniref:Uncharacterized protein n=1 Tax=Asparagus officinalis TaxID=4686 RepID=A0A5P1F0V7_ASPOF|nr:uncharacterized protein A4U43_C04F14670 [Asparagus officinalis]